MKFVGVTRTLTAEKMARYSGAGNIHSDEAAARSLLTFAFGSEVVEKVKGNDLFAYLEASLLSWLSHAKATPEGS